MWVLRFKLFYKNIPRTYRASTITIQNERMRILIVKVLPLTAKTGDGIRFFSTPGILCNAIRIRIDCFVSAEMRIKYQAAFHLFLFFVCNQIILHHIHFHSSIRKEGNPVRGLIRIHGNRHHLLSVINKDLGTEPIQYQAQFNFSIF